MFGAFSVANGAVLAITMRPVRLSSREGDFRSAVAHVAAGHCQRICMPGRWVVWMPEGASKPHARIFETPTQEAALCKCS